MLQAPAAAGASPVTWTPVQTCGLVNASLVAICLPQQARVCTLADRLQSSLAGLHAPLPCRPPTHLDVALLMYAVQQSVHDCQAHGGLPRGGAVGACHRLATQLAHGAKTRPSCLEELQRILAAILRGRAA